MMFRQFKTVVAVFTLFFTNAVTVLAEDIDALSGFYLKPFFSVHWSATEGFASTNYGPSKTRFKRATNYGISLGKDFYAFPVFIEVGIGKYDLGQRNHFSSYMVGSSFPDVTNKLKMFQVTVNAGYRFKISEKLSIDPHIGIRYVEFVKGSKFVDTGVVQSKYDVEDKVYFKIHETDFGWQGILLNIGTQVQYRALSKLSLTAGFSWDHGFKGLYASSMRMYLADNLQQRISNTTYNKGESIQASFGVKWLPFD